MPYRDDSTVVTVHRSMDSFLMSWRFGGDVGTKISSAEAWVRLSVTETGAEIHWSTSHSILARDADGMTEDIEVRAGSEAEPGRATTAMRRIIHEWFWAHFC
ncbi:hypothetical protein [Nocardia sp. NPDC049707]|uniref:hypothetical protein n=1 Tax=Nocardia sp. NPDC049707 TaxID=3154735 RepID=UPI003432D6E0